MQVNESVNVSNLLSVGTKAGKTPSIGSSEQTGDFASVFQNAAKPSVDTSKQGEVTPADKTKTDTSKKDVKSADSVSKDAARDTKTGDAKADSKEVKTDNTENTEPVRDADKTAASTDADAASETSDVAVLDVDAKKEDVLNPDILQTMEILSTLLTTISTDLQIPVETVAETMDELGMEVTDVLDTNKVKDLFLDVKKAGVTDLLSDEELNVELNAVLEDVETVIADSDMESVDVQEFQDAMQTADIKDVESFVETVKEEAFVPVTDNREPAKAEDAPKETTEPTVIVEKETDIPSDAMSKPSDNTEDSHDETPDETPVHKEVRPADKKPQFENPILQGISEAMDDVSVDAVPTQAPVNGSEVIRQIVEQVRVQMNQDNTSIQMQLYPEHLGRIQINVISKEGIMTAHIIAENEAAKQAIEGGLASLRDAMESQNIKVEAIEVMVSTTGFEQSNEQGRMAEEQGKTGSRRKANLSGAEDETEEEDAVEAEKMRASGSSVSYSV